VGEVVAASSKQLLVFQGRLSANSSRRRGWVCLPVEVHAGPPCTSPSGAPASALETCGWRNKGRHTISVAHSSSRWWTREFLFFLFGPRTKRKIWTDSHLNVFEDEFVVFEGGLLCRVECKHHVLLPFLLPPLLCFGITKISPKGAGWAEDSEQFGPKRRMWEHT